LIQNGFDSLAEVGTLWLLITPYRWEQNRNASVKI
jgi:hypothetical protein